MAYRKSATRDPKPLAGTQDLKIVEWDLRPGTFKVRLGTWGPKIFK